MIDFSKIYDFALVCIYTLGVIGSSAYLFYDGHGLFGFACLALAGMALPYLIKRIKHFIEP